MADCKKRTVTRKTTTGSTTLVTDTGVVYGPTAKLERIIVNQPGDQCQLTVYDGSTVIYQGILGDESTVMGKPQRPYEIAFGGAEIAGDLKVALSVPAAVSHFKLNAITGTVAVDSGSNATNGTLTNFPGGAEFVQGKIAMALEFEGTDDYIDCGSVNNFLFANAFSIAGWFYFDDFGTTGMLIGRADIGGNLEGWHIQLTTAAKLRFQILSTTGTGIKVEQSDTLAATNWRHIVFTYDGSGLAAGCKLYIMGSEIALLTQQDDKSGETTNTENMRLGSHSTGGWYFDGKMDDVRVYDEELTPEKVKLIYNGNIGTYLDFALADISVVYME